MRTAARPGLGRIATSANTHDGPSMLAVVADDLLVPLVIACAAFGTVLLGLGIALILEERRNRDSLREASAGDSPRNSMCSRINDT